MQPQNESSPADPPTDPAPPSPLIVLFDGTCGLCDSVVQFILKHDLKKRFRFAPLQSPVSRDLMTSHNLDPDRTDSVVLIDGQHAYIKSNAVLRIATELPEPWILAGLLVYVPAALRDSAYDYIARHRKAWFKPPDTCRTPTPQEREQFLV